MNITREWLEELAKKHGVRPKAIRDALWPKMPNKGLSYFDKTKNTGINYIETIADVLGCSVDEILRRPMAGSSQVIAGDNNQVGNVNINSDVESLKQIIEAQRQIISHQDAEIKRMEQNTREQLMVKDQQINDLGKRLDRLIELAQGKGDQ